MAHKLTLAQYRACTLKEKNALIDKVLFKNEQPSGRDYVQHIANAHLILVAIHEKAAERPGKHREVWFEMNRYLFNRFQPNSSVGRMEQAMATNPRKVPALIVEAYLLAVGEVVNER